jgi:hypothetical protein
MFTSKYFSTASVALLTLTAIEPIAAAPIKVIDADFADPSILSIGGKLYSYATGSGGKKVQVATADVFEGPWKVSSNDGLPDAPGWVASNPLVWAPDVVDRVCHVYDSHQWLWLILNRVMVNSFFTSLLPVNRGLTALGLR